MRIKLVCLILALGLSHAAAVVISGTNGSINTTGAGAGDGWNYVGTVGGASGIYLGQYGGSYWVMTAAHVGPGNFTLNANTYSYVGGSVVPVLNPNNSPTDLIVFQISTQPPSLPNLVLADSTAFADDVVMIGNGRNRAASETTWHVDTGTTPNVWSSTTTPESDITRTGYEWAPGNTKRWGENTVSGTTTISYSVSGTTRTVHSIVTDFDQLEGEGQAATGDSGGGIFHLNNNNTPLVSTDDFWELSGMMVTIGTFSGQPADTAVYGNLTYAVDIAYYKNQILAVVPEPGTLGLAGLALTVLTLASRRGRRGGS
jgi:hypothetical protein